MNGITIVIRGFIGPYDTVIRDCIKDPNHVGDGKGGVIRNGAIEEEG